jgi:hypothetical protein
MGERFINDQGVPLNCCLLFCETFIELRIPGEGGSMMLRSALRFRAASLFGAVMLLTANLGGAASLPAPTDKPILTVTGKISVTNKDGTAQFDRAMLEAIGETSFSTSTPWYKEPVKFEGVPMAKLLDAVGATGDRIVSVALNDYSAEMPMEDARKFGVILALKRDGEYMTVRDKGPIFIVYPFDSNPDLKVQKYYSRSVWQVSRIEVK